MGSWGSCDFSEFRKFAEEMDGLAYELSAVEQALLAELAARALRKVTQRTPVGVKPSFDVADIVKLKSAKRYRPYQSRNGESRFRNRAGKSYRFLTKSGEIREKYWSGYVGGNLRRSWQVGNIVRKGDGWEVEVFNTAEYASYVEYGHRQTPGRYVPALGKRLKASWVRGHFMMTITETELQAQSPALIERRMRAFFKEKMG